jgi:hypothetical protein
MLTLRCSCSTLIQLQDVSRMAMLYVPPASNMYAEVPSSTTTYLLRQPSRYFGTDRRRLNAGAKLPACRVLPLLNRACRIEIKLVPFLACSGDTKVAPRALLSQLCGLGATALLHF